MKQIDETAGRMGFAMRHARKQCRLSADEVAILLHITSAELLSYERGTDKIPTDIIERVFIMGYKMMRVRVLENSYRKYRRIFRKLKQSGVDLPQ